MPRTFTHYLPREMALLGLIECALSFAVIYALANAAGMSGSLLAAFGAFRGSSAASAASLTVITGAIAITVGLYRREVCLDHKRQLLTIVVAVAVAFTILFVLGSGISDRPTLARPLYTAQVLMGWLGTMTLIRLAYRSAVIRMPRSRRIVVLGDPLVVAQVCARLGSRRGRCFDPIVLGDLQLTRQSLQMQRVWAIVLASAPDALAIDPLLACKFSGMRIVGGAAFQEDYLGRIDLDSVTANDLLLSKGFISTRLSDAVKRLSDVGLAIIMLILLLPLMVLTALAIKVESAGPVFYCQQRVGRLDKPFMVFKFRSMAADAEAGGSPLWAQTKDPRVTRVGRFIRATRIDELPQLANVISGAMSLVGPRPERPHFVEQLERAIPFYRQRAFVKPGLTGWAQVNFPYGASIEDAREKLSYDLFYVKNRSILLDLVILLSTIRVVLFREGAR